MAGATAESWRAATCEVCRHIHGAFSPSVHASNATRDKHTDAGSAINQSLENDMQSKIGF